MIIIIITTINIYHIHYNIFFIFLISHLVRIIIWRSRSCRLEISQPCTPGQSPCAWVQEEFWKDGGSTQPFAGEDATYGSVWISGDSWMYPYQRTPMGNPYISPISTMGTLLGVHPIVPWELTLVILHMDLKIWNPFQSGGFPYPTCKPRHDLIIEKLSTPGDIHRPFGLENLSLARIFVSSPRFLGTVGEGDGEVHGTCGQSKGKFRALARGTWAQVPTEGGKVGRLPFLWKSYQKSTCCWNFNKRHGSNKLLYGGGEWSSLFSDNMMGYAQSYWNLLGWLITMHPT